MAAGLIRPSETEAHRRLKRRALIWAQAHGYSACALEVQPPNSRYRADLAAFGVFPEGERTVVFECKQALADLQRDNCESGRTGERLQHLAIRRETIERNLRVHYPTLRTGESLFPDYDAFDFAQVSHRGHTRVTRESAVLHHRLAACTKFEKLARYRCANLFYLVVPLPLRERARELTCGWGLLVEMGDDLILERKPIWQTITADRQKTFLRRIAGAATRALNRELEITREEIEACRPAV